jgi:hypothetical protein
MTWQPIETAPKDGTQVLLLLKNGTRVYLGWFVDSEDFQYGKSVRRRQSWTIDSWFSLGRGDPEPMHWMPIPEIPK